MYYPDDKVALLDEYFTKLKCTQRCRLHPLAVLEECSNSS